MSIKFTGILKCTGISALLTVLLVFATALLSYFTNMSETSLTIAVYASVVVSVFLGSFICVKASGGKALIHALITTSLFYAALAAATFVINGAIVPNSHFFTMTAGIFASGILGAVLGK